MTDLSQPDDRQIVQTVTTNGTCSPELALYVERCRVAVRVGYLKGPSLFYIECQEQLYWRARTDHNDATRAYTQLRKQREEHGVA